ncbi:lipopolysaccharide-modifying protein [Xylaria scruposa]|nr:lipopolysaccharide-modifying protein [Xylaria scruposa]
MLAATARLKYVVIAVAAFIAAATFYFALYPTTSARIPVAVPGSHDQHHHHHQHIDNNHTISGLIEAAYATFSLRLGKRSWSVAHAAARYRERRGRHPPPGFDKWFAAAQSRGAIVVEDFFDRIHHDINPFWGVDALEMRAHARAISHVIRVRDGKLAHFEGDNADIPRSDRLALWKKLVEDMLPHLPDLDMPVNLIDEPRMLVPSEDIRSYVAKEQTSRQLLPPDKATATQTSFADVDANPQPFDPEWIDDRHNYWEYVKRACPPDSPAQSAQSGTALDPMDTLFPAGQMAYMKDGFIANFSQAQDPCLQPHLRGMHGTFVEAFSMSTSTKLFPLFSGSKLPVNNELLIPAAMYLSDQTRYTGGASTGRPWADKKSGLIWRGTASGGRNQENNWWHYQRHRFVQMLNGSAVELVEGGDSSAGPTFNLQAVTTYNVSRQREGGLGPWLKRWSDVGFNRLDCWPERHDWLGRLRLDCPYTDPFFALVKSKPMAEQYDWKFIPDVDGNSYSARWRPFLLSTSCPLKATVYTEWHDDRLVPWLHFVPFDNTYMDIYAVMDYFLNGHDTEAQRIAEEGRDWAAKVLRKEDMMLYTWRLLLEYARVLDPERDRLGYVDDLMAE